MSQPEATTGLPSAVRPAGYWLVRSRATHSFLVHRRAVTVATVLTVALAAAAVTSLCLGETTTSPVEVVNVLLGRPSPDELVVGTLRLPRLTTGVLVGLAFGISGALVQTVARNPLASPDIIGVSQGASALTVAALVFGAGLPFSLNTAVLPLVSTAGGVLAALLVYAFAWRKGLHAHRFVLVGIGVSIALGSLTNLFLTKGDVLVAAQAQVWLTGSLGGRGYDQAAPVAWTLLAALPVALWAAWSMRQVSFDDHTATALGVRLGRVRLGMVALGVVLASVATGAAGPIGFVALISPQIARRVTRTAQVPLLCSALLGALVVVVADLLARRLFAPTELPAGVLTAAVGAPYLMWLIARARPGGNR